MMGLRMGREGRGRTTVRIEYKGIIFDFVIFILLKNKTNKYFILSTEAKAKHEEEPDRVAYVARLVHARGGLGVLEGGREGCVVVFQRGLFPLKPELLRF